MNLGAHFDAAFVRRLDSLRLGSRRRFDGRVAGDRLSARRGPGLDFVEYRPFATGDELRQVDWNIYARSDRLVVKQFAVERDLCLHLLVDRSASMGFGQPSKLTTGLQVAAVLGYVALAERERLAVALLDASVEHVLPPRAGRRQLLPLLGRLDATEAVGGGDLLAAAKRYAATAEPGVAVLVTDALDDGFAASLDVLGARGFDVQVVHVMSTEELDPPVDGELRVLDVEPDSAAALDLTYGERSRSAYRDNLGAFRDRIRRTCRARDIAYLAIDTTQSIDATLLTALRRERFVV